MKKFSYLFLVIGLMIEAKSLNYSFCNENEHFCCENQQTQSDEYEKVLLQFISDYYGKDRIIGVEKIFNYWCIHIHNFIIDYSFIVTWNIEDLKIFENLICTDQQMKALTASDEYLKKFMKEEYDGMFYRCYSFLKLGNYFCMTTFNDEYEFSKYLFNIESLKEFFNDCTNVKKEEEDALIEFLLVTYKNHGEIQKTERRGAYFYISVLEKIFGTMEYEISVRKARFCKSMHDKFVKKKLEIV